MAENIEPILSFVQRNLDASRGSWVAVSRLSGVPYHTLVKIAQRQSEDPRIGTVQKLADYFRSPGAVGTGGQHAVQP